MTGRLLAEFLSADALLAAARQTREASTYRVLDAYTPFAVEGLAREIEHLPPSRIKPAMLAGGVAGGTATLFLQWFSVTEILPVLAGGRQLASWPDFFFATFEMTVLGAALAGFVALLLGCGLPRLHHPLFDLPEFERATTDRFFLEIATDANGDAASAWLRGLGASRVSEVPR